MFTEAFPILPSVDLTRSLAFYCGVLGFTETYRFDAEDQPSYVSLTLGDSTIGVAEDPGTSGSPRSDEFHQFQLCLYTDDCERATEHLRQHDVPVLTEPRRQPWGEKMVVVADPDGHRVLIMSR